MSVQARRLRPVQESKLGNHPPPRLKESKHMPRKATAADAQLIMQLYDLRRESELRKARAWWANFWPQSADDVMAVASKFGSQENAWFRQASGYWEMAASMVVRGALNADLFFDANGEMWFAFA